MPLKRGHYIKKQGMLRVWIKKIYGGAMNEEGLMKSLRKTYNYRGDKSPKIRSYIENDRWHQKSWLVVHYVESKEEDDQRHEVTKDIETLGVRH